MIAANLLLLTLGLPAAYAFYRAVYNRYFHPLHHFLVPFWASVRLLQALDRAY